MILAAPQWGAVIHRNDLDNQTPFTQVEMCLRQFDRENYQNHEDDYIKKNIDLLKTELKNRDEKY